jgi:predicted transcriptional regulator
MAKGTKRPGKEVLSVRVDRDVKKKLIGMAKKNRRTLTGQMMILIEQAITTES